jgi:hypothetical protein
MKRLRLLAVLILFGCVRICSATEAIVASGGVPGYVEGTGGWSFDSLTSISVTSLGAFDSTISDSASPIEVGLWDHTGLLLASVTVTSNSTLVDVSRYQSITPVTLTAGLTYYLGAYATAGGTIIVTGESPPPGGVGGFATTSPQIQIGTDVYATNGGFTFPSIIDGDPHSGAAIMGPNFEFSAVPEPAVGGFALLGVAIVAFARRAQKR